VSRPAGIGFDIDHTIAIDNKLERVAFLRLLEAIVEDGGRARGTLEEETAAIDELLVRQRAGEWTIDEAVARFARAHGVDAGARYAARFRAMALDMVEEFVIPQSDARQAFATLRERGVALAVLSNGWNPLQTAKARRAGFEGPVLASSDLGAIKPDPRAFQALLRCFEAAPDDVWYVGDDPIADVQGARAAGLRAIWMDAEDRPFPQDLEPPKTAIRRLSDLAALLPDAIAR
jgi:HAD superfamily hydrolase (TIGR01509 family)